MRHKQTKKLASFAGGSYFCYDVSKSPLLTAEEVAILYLVHTQSLIALWERETATNLI